MLLRQIIQIGIELKLWCLLHGEPFNLKWMMMEMKGRFLEMFNV